MVRSRSSVRRVAAALGVVYATAAWAAAAAPGLSIFEAPPAGVEAGWAGSVHGAVHDVDPAQVAVLLYAETDLLYVQPYVGSRLLPDAAGRFAGETRGGRRYCAVLVRREHEPAATLPAPPEPGGDVLACACAPEAQRHLAFAGRDWVVKSTGALPWGPGPNLWSDAPDAVWVDAAGALHLRLAARDGLWRAAEVWSEAYLEHGRYRFVVDGPVDRLDANVVFAGFVYSDTGGEADVEFGRWGSAAEPANLQFVVQPDQVHGLDVHIGSGRSLHELDWQPERLGFASWAGEAADPARLLGAWETTGGVPTALRMRMRFNLWLRGGQAPSDGAAVEVVVRRFEAATPSAAQVATGRRPRLWVANPVAAGTAWRLGLQLPEAGRVALRVYDAAGRRRAQVAAAWMEAGEHALVWDPGRPPLGPGTYFVHLDGTGATARRKLVVVP